MVVVVIIGIEVIDQFVLQSVAMILCIGVCLWHIVDNLRVYLHLDEHI